MKHRWMRVLLGIGLLTAALPALAAERGFVLAVPDRGYLGNEQSRAVFAELAERHPAELLVVTDERTTGMLASAVERLSKRAEAITVLPLFVSKGNPRYGQLQEAVAAIDGIEVALGRVFGQSYLAVEILADRLRGVSTPADKHLVVAGHGASDATSCAAMREDLQRLADQASEGFGFDSVRTEVWPAWWQDDNDSDCKAATEKYFEATEEPVVVVPFALGPKLDSMMAFSASLERQVDDREAAVLPGITPHEAVSTWVLREANRSLVLAPEDIGVVFHAHGSDYHWNEGMRQAAADLGDDYLLEFAFSMGDQATIEPAVEALEARGAKAVVIVRVFGRKASFREGIRRMIGQDIEHPIPGHAHDPTAHHGMDHDGPPEPRIRTTAHVVTVGGLGADPLFARALLDRAESLSSDPSRETIILVAHGMGDDEANEAWMDTLEEIAGHMRDHGGDRFRAIEVGTWREDWPDKRDAAIDHVRALVEAANADGGDAIVVPARTTAQGHAHEFLEDYEFKLGEGFAPHPLFDAWLREQVGLGLAVYRDRLQGRLASSLQDVVERAADQELARGANH